MENRDNNAVAGALMLVAGGIIGAAVALLFAPQAGKKTRRDIVRYVKKSQRKAATVADDFSAAVADLVDTIGDKASEIVDRGKDVAEDVKADLLQAIEEGETKLKKQRVRFGKLFS